MDITEDRRFKQFLQNRNIKKNTIKGYKSDIKGYSEFLNQFPTDFINEAISEEKQGIWLPDRQIKEKLLGYKDFLVENNYLPRSVIGKLTTIKVFYREFDITVPRINFGKKNIRIETVEDLPTKDEIRKTLVHANIKYQTIIYVLLSTGLRSVDVRQLKYHDFLKSLDEYITLPKNRFVHIDEVIDLLNRNQEEKIIKWKIVTQKTDTPVTTFSTPECLEKLLEYLKLDPPATLDRYLFPSMRYPDQMISERAFAKYFKTLNDKCEYGQTGAFAKFRSHKFRKLFATTLMNQGLQQITISRLLGHSINAIQEAYIKQDDSALKEEYIKCVGALSLRDTNVYDVTTDDKKEFEEMKIRIKTLEEDLERRKRYENYPDIKQ